MLFDRKFRESVIGRVRWRGSADGEWRFRISSGVGSCLIENKIILGSRINFEGGCV